MLDTDKRALLEALELCRIKVGSECDWVVPTPDSEPPGWGTLWRLESFYRALTPLRPSREWQTKFLKRLRAIFGAHVTLSLEHPLNEYKQEVSTSDFVAICLEHQDEIERLWSLIKSEQALDTSQRGAKRSRRKKGWWHAEALILCKAQPGLSLSKIAREVGVCKSTVSRDRKFREILQRLHACSAQGCAGRNGRNAMRNDQDE